MALLMSNTMPRKRFILKLTILFWISYYIGKSLSRNLNKSSRELNHSNENSSSELSAMSGSSSKFTGTAGQLRLARKCFKGTDIVTFVSANIIVRNNLMSPIGHIMYLSRSYVFGCVCISADVPESIFIHIFFKNSNVSICFQTDQISFKKKGK